MRTPIEEANCPIAPAARTAVVIVNYHKAPRLIRVLESLRRQSVASSLTFVIVDNSTDEAEAQLLREAVRPCETLIVNDSNEGYSKACNAGVRAAGASDYVLLLNPDVVLDDPQAVEVLTGCVAADSTIGALGCLQCNDDGSYVENARTYPSLTKQVVRRLTHDGFRDVRLIEPLLGNPPAESIDVDWLQSSLVLVQRPLWDQIGGLEEAYYIFMADVDFCRRVHALGYRVAITSRVTVRADGRRASSGGLLDVFRSRALRIHISDAITYYRRIS